MGSTSDPGLLERKSPLMQKPPEQKASTCYQNPPNTYLYTKGNLHSDRPPRPPQLSPGPHIMVPPLRPALPRHPQPGLQHLPEGSRRARGRPLPPPCQERRQAALCVDGERGAVDGVVHPQEYAQGSLFHRRGKPRPRSEAHRRRHHRRPKALPGSLREVGR